MKRKPECNTDEKGKTCEDCDYFNNSTCTEPFTSTNIV